jgi:prophage regulatory protein
MADIQLIPLPDVLKRMNISERTLYRYVADGTFPKPVKIGPLSRWVEAEVDHWLEERLAAREA